MTSLTLSANQISDLSNLIAPLKRLTNLRSLGLNQNLISDLNPLRELTQLKGLGLRENRISDLTPLGDLENLTWLYVPFNLISDINPLKVLPNLTSLSVYGNKLPALFGKHAESLKKANPKLHIKYKNTEGFSSSPW